MTVRRPLVAPVLALALTGPLAAGVVLAPPALARGGDAVRADGFCSDGSTWTLKAAHDDPRLQVELEVDSGVVGQAWTWRLKDDGDRVAGGSATTVAPSGSFSATRRIPDLAGADRLVLVAVGPAGQTCRGALTV